MQFSFPDWTSPSADRFGSFKQALAGGVRRWQRDVAEALSAAWAWISGSHRQQIIVAPANGGFTISLRADGAVSPLGVVHAGAGDPAARAAVQRVKRLRRKGCRVIAVLGTREGAALVRTVTLPQATERHLSQVLRHQLSRLTPFPADRAVFDYDVSGRRIEDGQIAVRLAVAPRSSVEDLLTRLSALGLDPDRIVPEDDAESADFNLLPTDYRQSRQGEAANRAARRTVLAFASAFAAFVLINLGGKAAQWAYLTTSIGPVRERAEEASRLRLQVDALSGSSRYLEDRKAASQPMIVLVDEVSRLLPKGTWLISMRIAEDAVDLQGVSSDAAALLPLLETGEAFRDPVFAGAVNRNGSGGERFQIRAQLAGRSVGETP